MLDKFKKIKKYHIDFDTENTLASLKENSAKLEYSHKIKGRWENQYIDINSVPDIKNIFQKACQFSKKILKKPVIVPNKSLGLNENEFWFNSSKPGESTGWHDHKEKASLSAVFYLDVSQNSGNLQFRLKDKKKWKYHKIKPKNNDLVLFDSNLEHSVSENRSQNIRVSLAFNIYTLPLDIDSQSDGYLMSKFF
jgi:hypothetical protein